MVEHQLKTNSFFFNLLHFKTVQKGAFVQKYIIVATMGITVLETTRNNLLVA